MTEAAPIYQTIESAATEGLEDLFDLGSKGETLVIPEAPEGVTGGNAELLTLAEAARRLNLPYTTFYKQVKAGKHVTVPGPDGKPRVVMPEILGVTPGVTSVTGDCQGEVRGVFHTSNGVTEAKHLEVIQQMMAKLEGANYRIGWLESQLRERETDVQELKLLVDSQHKPSWWRRFSSWFIGR